VPNLDGEAAQNAYVAALASLFDSAGALGELEGFLSSRGAAFYRLPPPSGRLELRKYCPRERRHTLHREAK